MTDNELTHYADTYALTHGKPRDQLVAPGDLVDEYVHLSVTEPRFYLQRSYCRGHLRLSGDHWAEEVLTIAIPLTADDPRVLAYLARRPSPHPSEIAAALVKEQELIAFCRENARYDE